MKRAITATLTLLAAVILTGCTTNMPDVMANPNQAQMVIVEHNNQDFSINKPAGQPSHLNFKELCQYLKNHPNQTSCSVELNNYHLPKTEVSTFGKMMGAQNTWGGSFDQQGTPIMMQLRQNNDQNISFYEGQPNSPNSMPLIVRFD